MSLLGHDEITRRFAESLERIRIERGISQTEMAKYLDLCLNGSSLAMSSRKMR